MKLHNFTAFHRKIMYEICSEKKLFTAALTYFSNFSSTREIAQRWGFSLDNKGGCWKDPMNQMETLPQETSTTLLAMITMCTTKLCQD